MTRTPITSIALLLCATFIGAQTAQQYYDELYKAGGLDKMATGYVCFDEKPELRTFFIFGESKYMRQFLIERGGYRSLPVKARTALDRGFLNVRQYDRGVPIGDEEWYMKDSSSWVFDGRIPGGHTPVRIKLLVSWETLRYKKVVEVLGSKGEVKGSAEGYGRCEAIPAEVEQKAD